MTMEDWAKDRLKCIGCSLFRITEETADTLTGICTPQAHRGVVSACNQEVENFCQCVPTVLDIPIEVAIVRGTAFDPNQTTILDAIQADYGATSSTEAIRRAVALVGELLYPELM